MSKQSASASPDPSAFDARRLTLVRSVHSAIYVVMAAEYGAVKGYAFDTFLPEKFTRHTFRFFGTVMVIELALLVARWC